MRGSRKNWTPEESKYFDTREEVWRLQHEIQESKLAVARAEAGKVDAGIKVPEAQKALGRASQRISEIMRREGPNYSKVSELAYDEIMGREAWKATGKAGLQTDHVVPVREIEDTINQSKLPQLHSEASPAVKEAMEKEFQKLGDIRSNLKRMSKEANNMKLDRNWSDIGYEEAARHGYTRAMVDEMRRFELTQRGIIRAQIQEIETEFSKMVGGKAAGSSG